MTGDGAGIHDHPALVGDVNGDGFDDITFVGQNWNGTGLNIRTKLSDGNGNWTARTSIPGDGPGVHQYPTLAGDVNGDGLMDLVFVGIGWSGPGLNVRVKLSNGSGGWLDHNHVLGDGPAVLKQPVLIGDVNGDCRDDLIFMGIGWSGPGLNIRTQLSTGSSWDPRAQVLGDGSGVFDHPVLGGDVNGDGLMDLVIVGQNWSGPGLNVRVKFADGNGAWHSAAQVLGDGPGVHTYPTLIGDVNGDGKSDLIFTGQNWSGPGLNIRVKLSNGDGTWTPAATITGDSSGVHKYPALLGDVDNNGKDDLILVGQGWSSPGLNIRVKFAR